ncbi:DUF2017 family protein [Citricoccus sp. GCM10030269]|uniref:DUF2017 family protein n=1 Tax=Citricoccus sp. GCM10030269 TaxID=3273388 RepID=UPI0036064B37
MARAFKSTPKGFVAHLEKPERRLLRTLFNDVIQLLEADHSAPAAPESDAQSEAANDPETASEADPFWDIVSELGPLEAPASREAPTDEAMARLLPPGIHGDEDAAAEFRAMTEDGVRRAKTADLQRAVAALQIDPVVLDEQNAVAFSRALNDVRLVLSARLGIDSEEDAERVHAVDDSSAATDVDSYMALLYNFTTWLLESLMTALSTRLRD